MYRDIGSIPELKNERYPHKLIIFDTEAFRGEKLNGVELQSFRLGVYRYIELDKSLNITEDYTGYCVDPLALACAIDQYTRKDQTIYVYAHNIKYDLQLSGLLTYFLDRKWTVNNFVFSDPPTFIRLKRNRSSIMFVDTFNYWQTSLAEMGRQLGLNKLEMPQSAAPVEDWYIYCKRDVDVLAEYLLSFMRYLKDNDLCGLGITLANQAFRTFRHKFMDTPIILHNRKEALDLERAGYCGGRVEAFHIGQLPRQDYYKLDVNSMYPFVMKGKEYPYDFVGYSENISPDRLQALQSRYYVIAQVELSTAQAVYPNKHMHKLLFPIGSYVTTLHDIELQYALSHGHIVNIQNVAIYRFAPIFTPYIDYFYDVKVQAEKDGNRVIRHQAKILMNSLYGKFGQQMIISSIVPNTTGVNYGRITGYSESLGKRVEINCLGDNMEVSYKHGESVYSFPAIAGAVTAYARMYLWELITKAGLSNVYYVDTDSLVTNKTGYDNLAALLDPYELGYLKLEGVTDNFVINGAKDYIFGEDVKHKGVPHNAKELQPGKWEYEQFRGGWSWMKAGLSSGVEVYTRTKERKTLYNKGVIQPDNSILPVEFGGGG